MQNCLARDLAERLAAGAEAALGSSGDWSWMSEGLRLRFVAEVEGVTVMGIGSACDGGRRFRGDRRGESIETWRCPVVGGGVGPVQKWLWLGEGEARLRLARGGVEGLVDGVIFAVVAVVGVLDSAMVPYEEIHALSHVVIVEIVLCV